MCTSLMLILITLKNYLNSQMLEHWEGIELWYGIAEETDSVVVASTRNIQPVSQEIRERASTHL